MTWYVEFAEHLLGSYRELRRCEDTCVIFDLREVQESEAEEEKAASELTTNGRCQTHAVQQIRL